MKKITLGLVGAALLSACASSPKNISAEEKNQYKKGAEAIRQMAGCFEVDYSYVETEGLKKGYVKDDRVYDVSRNKNVKEWVSYEELPNERIRLQHILFFTNAKGELVKDSELKHQAEDWQFGANFMYDYQGDSTWKPVTLDQKNKVWLRRITNLDDGLRYQCAAGWKTENNPIDWTCDNYAPIPGRETRDMKRKDYQTLQRSTRLVVYGDSWLERQDNVKTIHDKGVRSPLAKEAGKNWYVALPDSECKVIKEYVKKHEAFWDLTRDTWDEILAEPKEFHEKKLDVPRFVKMGELEEKYLSQDLNDKATYEKAQAEVLETIKANSEIK